MEGRPQTEIVVVGYHGNAGQRLLSIVCIPTGKKIAIRLASANSDLDVRWRGLWTSMDGRWS